MRFINHIKEIPSEVYELCLEGLTENELMDAGKALKPYVASASEEYLSLSEPLKLHKILPADEKVAATNQEFLINLYEEQMVAKKGRARVIYDKIFILAENSICPFCNQQAVATLDHYLPKSKFPSLSVNPVNLIPCCSDCNRFKSTRFPKTEELQTLHPYFEDHNSDRWLFAKVVEEEMVSLQFYVDGSAFTGVMPSRLQHHFDKYRLARLYSSHSAVELQNNRENFEDALIAGGPNGLKAFLLRQALHKSKVFINSWQTAMYFSLADSKWFCEFGPSSILRPKPRNGV